MKTVILLTTLAFFASSSTALNVPVTPPPLPDSNGQIQDILRGILNANVNWLQDLQDYFKDVNNVIATEYPEAAADYQDLMKSLTEAILDPTGDAIQNIEAAVQNLLKYPEALRTFFDGLLGKLFDTNSDLYKKFKAAFDQIFDDIEQNSGNVAKDAQALLSQIVDLVSTVSKGVIEMKLAIFNQFAKGFQDIVNKIYQGFKDNFPKIYQNVILPLLKWLFDQSSAMYKKYVDAFEDILDDIASGVGNIGDDILKTVMTLNKLIVDVLFGILKIKLSIFLAFSKAFRDILSALALNALYIANNFAAIIGDLIEKLLKALFDVESALYKQFSDAFKNILDKIAADVGNILKYIPEFLSTFANLIMTAISGVIRAKMAVFNALAKGLQDILNQIYKQAADMAAYDAAALAAFADFLRRFFADFAAGLGAAAAAGFGAVINLLGAFAGLLAGGGGIIIL